MADGVGQVVPMSLARRYIDDLLQAGMAIPLVTVQKDMNVADLVVARRAAQPRPSWCSIFTKAYGKVVASRPDLRRAYLSFPRARMFEYTAASVDITAETLVNGEKVLVFVPLKQPETLPLLEIDRSVGWHVEKPAERLSRFRRALALARYPRFVRRWIWWSLLNVSGRKRSRYFSTFGVTSVGNWGVESVRPIAPCISILHYGCIGRDGQISIRLTYDHRVLDGSGPATALVQMEQFLHTDLLAEIQGLSEQSLRKAG